MTASNPAHDQDGKSAAFAGPVVLLLWLSLACAATTAVAAIAPLPAILPANALATVLFSLAAIVATTKLSGARRLPRIF